MSGAVAGIDEVGRGPVIGPMVLAGVVVHSGDLDYLKILGVRDSKKLTHRRRVELAEKIKRVALRYAFIEVSPEEIDRSISSGVNLNMLEARLMSDLIRQLGAHDVFIGSVDINADRFKKNIEKHLEGLRVNITVTHHAEDKYVVVAAASILAKCRREEILSQLKARYGDFGSGYPHDPATRDFLLSWVSKYGKLPHFVRKSWSTAKNLLQRGP